MTPKEHLERLDIHIEMTAITDGVYKDLKKQHITPLQQTLTNYEQLQRDVKSVYAELIMYIGNNLMIENEELDIDYLTNIVMKLEKVGKENE